MRWAILYIDGSSFTNEDGAPEDAPGAGVVAIGQEDAATGLQVHHQEDFYGFDEQWGGWYGLDYYGLAQYIARPGKKVLKLGDNVKTDDYLKAVRSLQAGNHLPAKSARYSWEPPWANQ